MSSKQPQPLGSNRSIRPFPRTPDPGLRGRNGPTPSLYTRDRSQSLPRYQRSNEGSLRAPPQASRQVAKMPSNPAILRSVQPPGSHPFPMPDSAPNRPPPVLRKSDDSISPLGSSSVTSHSTFYERSYSRSAVSSRTDLEDTPPKYGRQEDALIESHDRAPDVGYTTSNAGSSLWSRIVVAAGSLNVNVSKAIEAGVTIRNGEETPEGAESRITAALKEYYLSRAHSSADLPSWLFDERDRGVMSSSNRTVNDAASIHDVVNKEGRSGGIIPRQAFMEARIPPRKTIHSEGSDSKAANRLKAMRDAKRVVTASQVDSESLSRRGREGGYHAMIRTDTNIVTDGRPQRRLPVGLPAGPGRLPP